MPKFLLALLLASAISLAAAQAQVRQALPLRSVILYLEGGELHHEGTLSLPAGTVEVQVRSLSPYLSSTGLQAEASGAELERLDLLPTAAAQSDTLRHLRHELEVLTAEKEFLRANTTLAAAPGRWAEDMQRGLAYYSKRVVQVNERLALLEERQRNLGAQATASPREVLLHLLVPHAGPVRLRLSYRVVNLGTSPTYWQPTYELRVGEDNLRQLRAVSRALVHNGTGLDWAGVPVTLRTASPAGDMNRPTLDPWAVSYGRAGNQGEGNLADFAVKGPGTAGTTTGATSAAPDLGASLRLPAPVTLASAATQTFKLGEYTLPMRLEYLAVPKRDDDVFLVGRVSDWNQVNFLAETATVFYRGAYVGETTLDTRAYTDTLEVALGRDPQVQLTRTKREDFARTSGGREKTHLAYEINVKNTHPYPVRLRLLDQVPVSQEKDIVVKVQETGGATLDADSGKLTWLFGLGAGASRKFPVAFTVEAPEDKAINLRRDRTIKSPKFR